MPTRSAASFRVGRNEKRPKTISTGERKRCEAAESLLLSRTSVFSTSAQRVLPVRLEAFACSAYDTCPDKRGQLTAR